MIQNFILFSIVLGTSLFSFAKVTNVTVLDSTASKFEMTAGTTSGAANVYTIFGGNAGAIGGCTTPTSGSVCNSCTGTGAPTTYCTTAPKACAERSIYPTLKLGIQLTMDTIPTNPAIRIEVGSSTATITADSGSSTSFAANQAFTVYIPWSALCDDNAACMTPTKKTLTVGLVDASSSTAFAAGNSQVFTVKIRGVDGATATTNTPTKEPTATQAVTDFSVFPGDGKVFINDIYRGAEGPGDASDIKWQAVRVFYDEFTGNPNYCSIPVDSAGFADLYFTDKTKAETSLGQSYLEGLTNDVPYMFTVATVDEASVVSQFLQIEPPSGQEATYAAQYTATPAG